MASSLFGPASATSASSTFTSIFSPSIQTNTNLNDHNANNHYYQLSTEEFLTLASNEPVNAGVLETTLVGEPSSSTLETPLSPPETAAQNKTQADEEHINQDELVTESTSSASVPLNSNSNSDASYQEATRSSNTSVHESPISSPIGYNDEFPATKWDLRPRDLQNTASHTWVDHDDSGDYNPADKDGKPFSAPLRRKRSIGDIREGARGEEGDDGPKRAKLTSWLSARQNGISLPVVLKLNSAKGKELLRGYTDNWPEDPWNTISDDTIPPRFANGYSSPGHESSSSALPYNFRSRAEDPDSEDLSVENLIGHPFARGCKGCISTGQTCPLITSPSDSYPCQFCEEDGLECELLVPPKKKQNCEHCRKRRKKCSYGEDGSNHVEPCEQCWEEGFQCVAGPAHDSLRVRMAADGTPVVKTVGPKRPRVAKTKNDSSSHNHKRETQSRYATCTNCRDASKRCSLRKNAVELPCRYCDENSLNCPIEDDNTTTTVTTNPVESHLIALRTHASRIRNLLLTDYTPTNVPIPQGFHPRDPRKIKQITTFLAHPIIFNCPPPTRYKPCHWHLSPAFGLAGLGPPPSVTNTVSVYPLANGKGYREVSGGHTETGITSCRMCIECTMDRVLVCVCPSHHLERINLPTSAANQSDWATAFSALERSKPGSAAHKVQLARWCSICPSPANFRCTTNPNSAASTHSTTNNNNYSTTNTTNTETIKGNAKGKEKATAPTTTTPPPGCGLTLCDPCALIFTDLYANDLQRMVAGLKAGVVSTDEARKFWPRGLRADWDFFGEGKEGFLVRQVLGG